MANEESQLAIDRPLRMMLATDAWRPQVSGVVRTWETTIARLVHRGHIVKVIEPNYYTGFPCPFYPEIRLSIPSHRDIVKRMLSFRPDAVHIATEGPIGLAVRSFCRRHGWRYTTSYHTKFPEYLQRLAYLPASISYTYMRWFHRRSDAILTATPSLDRELQRHGFTAPMKRWSRGVDLDLFHPRPRNWECAKPIMLYVGRVSKEKSIEDFLRLNIPGTKVIVGDGPYRTQLEAEFPKAVFLGYRKGEGLAECYANADLLVFPSKTDTFGLVMIEALACGVPVAGYPVVGPIDIITDDRVGALDDDLGKAVEMALSRADRDECIRVGRTYTWDSCTDQLLSHLVPVSLGSCRVGEGFA